VLSRKPKPSALAAFEPQQGKALRADQVESAWFFNI